MKIAQKVSWLGDTLVVKTTHDNDIHLAAVAELKERGVTGFSENRLVGRVPFHIFNQWLKEAGLRWDSDTEAINEVMRKKLLDGEFAKLRVWEGTF